jgi:hypothetical protein
LRRVSKDGRMLTWFEMRRRAALLTMTEAGRPLTVRLSAMAKF